jgi:hypothetical protein
MITMFKPMQPPFSMARIISAALLVSLTFLSGCSALRFAYNQAPDLTYWWLDGYVDLNDTQSPRVHEALNGWFAWHRANEVPVYVDLLARAEREVLADASPEQMCRWYDEGTARFEVAIEHALPPAADLARSLTPAQLTYLERRYAKNNKDFAKDYLQDTPEDRQKASVKRAQERAETLYGRLDDDQRQVLAEGIARSPFDAQLWLAERKSRQDDVLATLRRIARETTTPAESQAALRALVTRVRASPNAEYKTYQQRLVQANCQLASQVHDATTPEQRRNAARKLKGWEDDLRSLLLK